MDLWKCLLSSEVNNTQVFGECLFNTIVSANENDKPLMEPEKVIKNSAYNKNMGNYFSFHE